MPLRLLRRGDVWYVRGTVAGRSVYESTRIGDRKAAEIYRARREAEIIERVAFGRSPTTTFAEAALTYMQAGGEGKYLAPILRHLGPRFRLADMDTAAVNACAAAIYPTAAPATINRQVITPISAVVNLAADDGLCVPRRFRRRKAPPVSLRWLTPEEVDLMLAKADAREAALISFFLGTGCRTGEGLGLQVADLHLDTREAWIGRTKNGHPRMVRFPDRTRRALTVLRLPEAGAVFRTPKGRPYRLITGDGDRIGGQIKGMFDRILSAAGIAGEVTPHTMRHTWATWYYAQTRDFGGLMDLGGWQKADMANRYRKLAPADLGARLLKAGWDFRAQDVQLLEPAQELSRNFKAVGTGEG
jgi:integrase